MLSSSYKNPFFNRQGAHVKINLENTDLWTSDISPYIKVFHPPCESSFFIEILHIHWNFSHLLDSLFINELVIRSSLVAQWLGICLPVQGARVRALVREDPTCRGATKPVRHDYWACSLEPASHSYWAHVTQLLKPVCLEPVLRNGRGHRSENPAHRNKE